MDYYSKRKHSVVCSKILMTTAELISSESYDIEDIYGANSIFLKYPPKYTFVIYREGREVGFIGVDVIGGMAFLNCLQMIEQNLGVYAVIEICRILSEEGILYMNLSGSESEDVFKWKMKFHPIRLLYRTHMVYEVLHE